MRVIRKNPTDNLVQCIATTQCNHWTGLNFTRE